MNIMNVGLIDCGADQLPKATPMEANYNLKKVLLKGVHGHEAAKSFYPKAEIVHDMQSIIHDESIDLVLISSPSNEHFDFVSAALKAGKHVRIL